ncbi:MAG: 3-deoxy-8-phosphooctulonate synthase [Verrucomicrobia bacterium]|nr:MAG: 3-deoxy-8-phosphooctulonate synthase [Verrucomicrobiota bacterium]
MKKASISIGKRQLGGKELLFILGPCVIESRPFLFKTARKIHEICEGEGASFIFKASYDKANRSSLHSFRGSNVEEGCKVLHEVGKTIGAPVTTDVHSPAEAEIAAAYIDLLQIPAFLCRQTDLILAAAATKRIINVKKGQFLAPWEVTNIAQKLEKGGCRDYFFTERGTTFGYNNLVADMRSIFWIQNLNYRVVFDATHSVQRPGGAGTSTSGDAILAPVLARAAVAAGCDGIFLETHPNPKNALSDGPNQIPLRQLPRLLRALQSIRNAFIENL